MEPRRRGGQRADVNRANRTRVRTLMRRLRTTIYSTAVWANTHLDESAEILAKYAKLDPEVVRTMNRSPYGTALTPDMLQPYLDLGYKYKYTSRPLKASDLIAKL